MKKSLILSFITLLLSLSVVVGGTFALFTAETHNDIVVSSGRVSMTGESGNLKIYSTRMAGDEEPDGYDAKQRGFVFQLMEGMDFLYGGNAVLDGAHLYLNGIKPGDRATYDITCANSSNVEVAYRISISSENTALLSVLELKVAGETITSPTGKTDWQRLPIGVSPEVITVSVYLSVDAGNEYQNSYAEIVIQVEAIQSNAVLASE